MCWSESASLSMTVLGVAATGLSMHRRAPTAIPLTLGYFTAMEALQAAGYWVIDDCGGALNQSITLLSVLHIVFQPFFINAFALELVPGAVKARVRAPAYLACALSATVMLMQLYPFAWAGACRPGDPLCGLNLCLMSGEWHLAWSIPYNGLILDIERTLGSHFGFPTYVIAALLVPLVYGSWRLVLLNVLAGPVLAGHLTANPNEWPAIWCLFSVCIVMIGMSTRIRRRFVTTDWLLWPPSWRAHPSP